MYSRILKTVVELIITLIAEILPELIAVLLLAPGYIVAWASGDDPEKEHYPKAISAIFWILTIIIGIALYVILSTPEV